MRNVRLISKLDIKAPNLVKTIQIEGLRKIGNPNEYAIKYYNQGIDEIIYNDVVASLYNRNNIFDIIKETTNNVFVPITVGGGLRSSKDVEMALRNGADKIFINTAAINNKSLVSEISRNFGSQCLVINIQCKKLNDTYEAYYDSGRERSYKNCLDWALEVQDLGAGELLITSIDNEGTGKGFDLNLINIFKNKIEIPLIFSGGMGTLDHLTNLFNEYVPDAICMSKVLHYDNLTIKHIRDFILSKNIPTRQLNNG